MGQERTESGKSPICGPNGPGADRERIGSGHTAQTESGPRADTERHRADIERTWERTKSRQRADNERTASGPRADINHTEKKQKSNM